MQEQRDLVEQFLIDEYMEIKFAALRHLPDVCSVRGEVPDSVFAFAKRIAQEAILWTRIKSGSSIDSSSPSGG
jgi:hypothetical protein